MAYYSLPSNNSIFFNLNDFTENSEEPLTLFFAKQQFIKRNGDSVYGNYIWFNNHIFKSNTQFQSNMQLDNVTMSIYDINNNVVGSFNNEGNIFCNNINNVSNLQISFLENITSDIQQQITKNLNDVITINDITIPNINNALLLKSSITYVDSQDNILQSSINNINNVTIPLINQNINSNTTNITTINNITIPASISTSKSYTDTSISSLIANAPSTMDNLYEISNLLTTNTNNIGDIIIAFDNKTILLQNNINLKSDITYVDTQHNALQIDINAREKILDNNNKLLLKSDITYVDTQDNALQIDINAREKILDNNNKLLLKSDITYVDAQDNALQTNINSKANINNTNLTGITSINKLICNDKIVLNGTPSIEGLSFNYDDINNISIIESVTWGISGRPIIFNPNYSGDVIIGSNLISQGDFDFNGSLNGISTTIFNHLSGLSSNIQTQITSNDTDILNNYNTLNTVDISLQSQITSNNTDILNNYNTLNLVDISLQSQITSNDTDILNNYNTLNTVDISLQSQITSNDTDILNNYNTLNTVDISLQSQITSNDTDILNNYNTLNTVDISLQSQITSNDTDILNNYNTLNSVDVAQQSLINLNNIARILDINDNYNTLDTVDISLQSQITSNNTDILNNYNMLNAVDISLQSQITSNDNTIQTITHTNNSVNITPIFDTTYNTSLWYIPFTIQQEITILPSSTVKYIYGEMHRVSKIDVQANNTINNYVGVWISPPSNQANIIIDGSSKIIEACNLRVDKTNFAENNFSIIANGNSKIDNIKCESIISLYDSSYVLNMPATAYETLNTLAEIFIGSINVNGDCLINLKPSINTEIKTLVTNKLFGLNSCKLVIKDDDANIIYTKISTSPNYGIGGTFESVSLTNIGDSLIIENIVQNINFNLENTNNNVGTNYNFYITFDANPSSNLQIRFNLAANPNTNNIVEIEPSKPTLNYGFLLTDKIINNKIISTEINSNNVIVENIYLNNKIYTNNIYTPIIRCMMTFIYNSNGFVSLNDNDTLLFSYSSSGRYNLTFQNVVPPNTYYNVVCNGTKSGDETYANNLTYLSFSKLTTSFYIKQFSGSSPENHNAGGWTNITVYW